MDLNEFDYKLPHELIAQDAVFPKDSSRLMVVGNHFEHRHFSDLINFLEKGDVIVINETKVARALIHGKKETGAKARLILEQMITLDTWRCRISTRSVRIGHRLIFPKTLSAEVTEQDGDMFTVKFNKPLTDDFLDTHFELPGPPYIKKSMEEKEYQTTYSKTEGSLAAPTAGLHFTQELMKKIENKGIRFARICLHVGFGTFLPIRGDINDHKMHEETFEVTKQAADTINNRKGRLVVVGTTSVRTLESCADENGLVHPKKGSTDIFIYPGYTFKTDIHALITNFHLPKSTLLLLVSAFRNKETILKAYNEAVKQKYRFFSLGDSMLIFR